MGPMNERPQPSPQVWLTLRAADALALIRFLVDVVGFEETVVFGDGDQIEHAQLSWPPGGGVMLCSARTGDDDGGQPEPGGSTAYVVAHDVDAIHARAAAAGAQIVEVPHDTDYGSRDFALRDPEGNHWSFGTYRGEPPRCDPPRDLRGATSSPRW
jgi:uncharacterized glyoxalase superfamily protein PhnB